MKWVIHENRWRSETIYSQWTIKWLCSYSCATILWLQQPVCYIPPSPSSPSSPQTHTHTHILGSRGPTGGVVYTRWGNATCPSTTGTQLLYAGRAAGSLYTEQGGGANYLCLPEQPQYSTYTAGTQDARAHLYGAEKVGEGANGPFDFVSNHSVPCAVCYTLTWRIVVMIPAQYTCPQSWTREYYGYLMANRNNYHRTMYECIDHSPHAVITWQYSKHRWSPILPHWSKVQWNFLSSIWCTERSHVCSVHKVMTWHDLNY